MRMPENKRNAIKDLLRGKKKLTDLKQRRTRFETDERGVEFLVMHGDGVEIWLPHNNRESKEFLLKQK